MRELLDKGADVDHASKSGDTALILSCQNGHTETAALLLDRGAAIDHANNSGSTALSLAKSYGYTAIVALLEGRLAKAAGPWPRTCSDV